MYKTIIYLVLVISWTIHAEEKKEYHVGQLNFGGYVSGPKFNMEKLENKITLIHVWSMLDQPQQGQKGSANSVAESSTLSRFYEGVRDKGIVVIGAHVQLKSLRDVDKPALWKFCQQSKISYMVVMEIQGEAPEVNSVPYSLVYDVGGKLVFHGDTDKAIKKAKELLPRYSMALLGEQKFKVLKQEAQTITQNYSQNKNLGQIYKKLQGLTNDKNEEKKKEAELLLEILGKKFISDREELNYYRNNDPELYQKEKFPLFLKIWQGHDEIKKLEEEFKALGKNKEFSDTLQAQKLYQSMEKTYLSMKPASADGKLDLTDAKVRKKNANEINNVRQLCQILVTKYPSTAYANEAKTMLKLLE